MYQINLQGEHDIQEAAKRKMRAAVELDALKKLKEDEKNRKQFRNAMGDPEFENVPMCAKGKRVASQDLQEGRIGEVQKAEAAIYCNC